MTAPRTTRSREISLILLMLVQAFCASFFLGDVIEDALEPGGFTLHVGLEIIANLALICAIVVEGWVLWVLLKQQSRTSKALSVAQGAMAEVIEDRFAAWGLTPSEADVAGFTIKGFSIAEVAELRGSSEATVKTHLNAVYRKAGVSGRTQLVSVFVEDLLAGPVA
ncbi:helix-turn-helix transcriptional regulator [Pseudothioclava nitratireducens]|uniref:helix-turn-helix transcriptional regulator n=1 Tax=Pseudothioclava nitratireducens TaxID=1928646 RepID=UPI0023DACEF8|nr:helix-turn-helix transcriptional regulator [Defluviimonas nitratireducens]MDF1620656.1 helix-turn-helix transcriptional regulator [Defluviimonas nitratireducens]